jgi:hypothetical protein
MIAMPTQINIARERRQLIGVAAANVLAFPLYAIQVLQLTPLFLPFFGAIAVAVVAGGLISVVVTWTWMREARLGAAVQLAALLPLLMQGVNSHGSLNAKGLVFSDFLDFRILLGVVFTVVVPGVLIGVALSALRGRGSRTS